MGLLRSLLFVPANRPNMIEKARNLPADVLMLDLEDSVPTGEKVAARSALRQRIVGCASKGQQVYVRVNAFVTGLAEKDLEAALVPGVDGISLPKVESEEDIKRVDALIATLEQAQDMETGKTRLIPLGRDGQRHPEGLSNRGCFTTYRRPGFWRRRLYPGYGHSADAGRERGLLSPGGPGDSG